MFLINALIIIFIVLICYQIFLAFSKNNLVEGLENADTSKSQGQTEYKPYNVNDPNNALILAQQNAGNIEVLKGRLDNLEENNKKIPDMQLQINAIQTQVDGLVQQQAEYAQQLAGSTPPTITGTEPETAP
jgi:uncharacterized protein YoxC